MRTFWGNSRVSVDVFCTKGANKIQVFARYKVDSRVIFKQKTTLACNEASLSCIAHLRKGCRFSQALFKALCDYVFLSIPHTLWKVQKSKRPWYVSDQSLFFKSKTYSCRKKFLSYMVFYAETTWKVGKVYKKTGNLATLVAQSTVWQPKGCINEF